MVTYIASSKKCYIYFSD